MAPHQSAGSDVHPGTTWLLNCTADPIKVQRAWAAQQPAPIATDCWAAVEAPLIDTVNVVSRLDRHRRGPLLGFPEEQLAWWLVPADVGDVLDDVPRLRVLAPGSELLCPPADRTLASRLWLALPDGSGQLTDPDYLGAAFSPSAPLLVKARSR